MTAHVKAHLGLLGTNLFFASNYSAIKYFTGNHYAGPFGINIIRIGVSVILFWLLFLFNPVKNKIDKKDIPAFLLCAVTGLALNQMLFIKGLSYTFSIHASLLTLITPILITIIAAMVLKERITILKIVGLVLAVTGAIVLIRSREITTAGENIPLGDALVICSAVAYTFYFIGVKPLMIKYSAIDVMRWVFTFGFFIILPLCVKEFKQITWQVFTLKDYVLLFLIAVPGTFLAYIFNAYGIKMLNASVAGAYIYSQPVFAVAIAMIFLKEQLLPQKIFAAVLIFAGVYLSNMKMNKGNAEKQNPEELGSEERIATST
ncbi:MAG: DMT family transporter [Bacteroidota bacterium]|nr:DMT family transporter [Bacteroidota bacterium]